MTSEFTKFLPDFSIKQFHQLLSKYTVLFKIVKPRKTKLGDFRALPNKKPVITINSNLNPYAFLITSIHELAHLETYLAFGHKTKPHGKEWKSNYSRMLYPFIQTGNFPKDIEIALVNSLVNVKASSCTDQNLYRVLLKYDTSEPHTSTLEDVPKNSTFVLNNKTFIKGIKKRTRYICKDSTTRRDYLINGLVRVTLLRNEE